MQKRLYPDIPDAHVTKPTHAHIELTDHFGPTSGWGSPGEGIRREPVDLRAEADVARRFLAAPFLCKSGRLSFSCVASAQLFPKNNNSAVLLLGRGAASYLVPHPISFSHKTKHTLSFWPFFYFLFFLHIHKLQRQQMTTPPPPPPK